MGDSKKIEIDIEALQQAGKIMGAAFAVFRSSFLAGYKDEVQRQQEIKARERAAKGSENAPAEDGAHKRCERCWCDECALFEDCIVPIEGYDIESKPCPCDGCYNTGKPYMPKEKPPCENFKPKDNRGAH